MNAIRVSRRDFAKLSSIAAAGLVLGVPLDAETKNAAPQTFDLGTFVQIGTDGIVTVWITTSLLERSLGYATTEELNRLSRTLEGTVRQFYQRERDSLKQDALDGRVAPTTYGAPTQSQWPEAIRSFWESGEAERFGASGLSGESLELGRLGSAQARLQIGAPMLSLCEPVGKLAGAMAM